MNIVQEIEKYNLCIRRIPEQVVSLYDIRHKKEGDEIITKQNGRQFVRRIHIPEKAGWYMCKQVNNTDSTVQWSYKTDNLAETLEESIKLFISKQERTYE